MRTTHWKAHLLPLLFLSLHSVSVCLAASCGFDEFIKYSNMHSKIITAARQQTDQEWKPIRIVASAKDLEGQPKYCMKKEAKPNELSTDVNDPNCIAFFDTIPAGKITSAMSILEKAIKLHTDRLFVQRVSGPLKIPDFSEHPHCKFFNVPEEHRTTGVDNADMVLYVAYVHGLDDNDKTASLGLTCAKSEGGRPIAGGLKLGSGDVDISRHSVRLIAHQIAHGLGFSYNEMNSRKMIINKTVRGKTNPVSVVKTEKTKEMARAHYGCSTADGMELEDGREIIKKPSHWERRNAKDELMATPTGRHYISFMGYYTALTMAAFEDLGYYKANFQMAEHMEYGHKVGCEFLTSKCMENGVTEWPKMFCNVPKSKIFPEVCTTDRMGFGDCLLKADYNPSLSTNFQYFESPNKGGDVSSLTDYCPVVEQERYFGCTNTAQQGNVPGGLYGMNSMCLDGNDLNVKTSGGSFTLYRAVCAEISCDGGSVKVKYLGDPNKWHDCPEGKSLNPSLTSKEFQSGTIKCPKYEEVCIVAPDGSSLVKGATHKSIEPSASASPTESQDPKAAQKPKGQPNNSNSGVKSKDNSSVPFGLIHSVVFLVLSFAGYMIA